MKKQIGRALPLFMALLMTAGLFLTRAQAANNASGGRCGDGVLWSLDSTGVLTIFTDGTPGPHRMANYVDLIALVASRPWGMMIGMTIKFTLL